MVPGSNPPWSHFISVCPVECSQLHSRDQTEREGSVKDGKAERHEPLIPWGWWFKTEPSLWGGTQNKSRFPTEITERWWKKWAESLQEERNKHIEIPNYTETNESGETESLKQNIKWDSQKTARGLQTVQSETVTMETSVCSASLNSRWSTGVGTTYRSHFFFFLSKRAFFNQKKQPGPGFEHSIFRIPTPTFTSTPPAPTHLRTGLICIWQNGGRTGNKKKKKEKRFSKQQKLHIML